MSYSIRVVDTAWKKKGEKTLSDSLVNDAHINQSLLHEYVIMYLANNRVSTAHTKNRWAVRWSWRKLYRQKGTGNARVWDAASPIRRSGGVAFWPNNQKNRKKSMPKKMRYRALVSALTLRAKEDAIMCVKGLLFDTPKTSDAAAFLTALGITDKKTLLVSTAQDTGIILSFRNIWSVSTVSPRGVNPYTLLAHQNIVFTESALEEFENTFTS